MSARRRRTTDDEIVDESDSLQNQTIPPVRHGVLDDVPDDFELNIEGFRYIPMSQPPSAISELMDGDEPQSSVIASSLLRHPEKSYTKLEVISARQIRGLIIFFNTFVVLSIAMTIFTVIQGNGTFKKEALMFLPGSMLHQWQKDQSPYPGILIEPGGNFTLPSLGRFMTQPVSAAEGGTSLLVRTPDTSAASICDMDIPPAIHSAQFRRKTLALYDSIGIHRDRKYGGFYIDDNFIKLPPGMAIAVDCSKNTVRQVSSNGTGVPPPSTSGPNFSLPVPGAPDSNGGTVNQGPRTPPSLEGAQFYYAVPAKLSNFSQNWKRVAQFATGIASIFFFLLSGLFGFRLIRAKRRNMTHEQIWVFILILATACYMNPVSPFTLLVELRNNRESKVYEHPKWVEDLQTFFALSRDVAFNVMCLFYVWASLHSFRILDPMRRLAFRSFYLPKLIVLFAYSLFHLLAFILSDLWMSEVPTLSGLAFAFAFSPYRAWSHLRVELLLSVFKTVFDLAMLILIGVEAVRTMRILERAPYMKHRTKRVGFRFFLFINVAFYSLLILQHSVILFGIPKSVLTFTAFVGNKYLRIDVFWYMTIGPIILVIGYVLSTAYVYLPYTSVGWLKGWFVSSELGESTSRWSFSSQGRSDVGSSVGGTEEEERTKNEAWANDEETPVSLVDNDAELQQQIVEPITYRKRESKDSLELKANCFTMQTHVIMFNFAWYVYYYGTPKLDTFRPKENPLPFEFRVDKHVKSEATDTQALVLDCTDRIIVTFKGTTSLKNLKTSLRMSHERLMTVIRYNADGEDEFARLRKLFGQRYIWGKVHKGFATAYLDVAEEVIARVRALRSVKKRPVFLTGHSLGGALATICSLDLWVKLNVSRREIFVSTFGSPRVGNSHFAAVYKEVVPLHWRIVVDPDMIAKLPRVGYEHVGKKVVLTPHGEMIIDPSALEQRPWTGEAAGFAYHRKASYMLAMRAWCVRNHGMTYTPVFWPFPVRPEDERRFAGAFDEEDGNVAGRVAAKIIRMDAMVDALGDGMELDNMAVVEKWGRLTRRALLNDKLSTTP